MDQANLERKLTNYFQTEVDGADLEPSVEWWRNILGACRTAQRTTGLAAAGERFGAWWHRPAIKLRSAMVAVPVMVVMILLAVLQPWTPTGGGMTVMAMEQLIEKVKTTNTYDVVHSFRVIACDSVIIDSGEITQYLSDKYDFAVTPDKVHITKTAVDGKITKIIFTEGGSKEYYQDTPMGYTGSMNLIGGAISKSKTLVFLRYITDVQQLENETIDGIDCLHYKGVSKGTFGTAKAPIELWVGKDDYLIRQIKQVLPEQTGTNRTAIRKYYDFNSPITIQAPIASSGELIAGWNVNEVPASLITIAPSVTVAIPQVTMTIIIPSKDGVPETTQTFSGEAIILSSEWIRDNDTCPDPLLARVTFPTSWLYDSPFPEQGNVRGVYAPGGLLQFAKISQDVNTYFPGFGKLALEIGEQYTTFFFPFFDEGRSMSELKDYGDMLNSEVPERVTLPPVVIPN